MFEEVTYISCIANGKTSTYYFYHKKTKTLVPIQLDEQHTSLRLRETHPGIPPASETLRKVISAVGAKVLNVKIYLFQDSVFYTYITITNGAEEIEINANFMESMTIAEQIKSPILFEKNVIKECGFKVTKRMIEKALLG